MKKFGEEENFKKLEIRAIKEIMLFVKSCNNYTPEVYEQLVSKTDKKYWRCPECGTRLGKIHQPGCKIEEKS